jgi:pimeloyl-ACP methyl ester carboxylesterase
MIKPASRRGQRLLFSTAVLLLAFVVAARLSGNHPEIDIVAAGRATLDVPLESARVPTNGIELHVVFAGPKDGPPVVLLHGFPEFWWGWHHQIAALAKAGFRVIAPDQRGYDLSDKPRDVGAYRLQTLEADIVDLTRHLGYEATYLAGHDWGGMVAWRLAIDRPDHVRKLVIFNMGHPLAFRDAAQDPAHQQESISWYRVFFQIPMIPELTMRFGDWGRLVENLRDTSRPGAFSDEDIRYYKSAWSRPNAMRSMVNWYRAGFRYWPAETGDGMVHVPTHIVWGVQEVFMESRLAGLSAKHCDDAQLTEIPDAGHWLLHEEPQRTSQVMIDFFRDAEPTPEAEGSAP